jgi:phosphoglycerate transport regulatory protein PgtC
VNFDSDLSEARYYLVSSIFDQTITFRHKELVAATKAINQAAARLAATPNAEAQKLLAEARDLAYSPIVGEGKAKDQAFLALFRDTKRDAQKTKQLTGLEEYWNSTSRKNYARAVELANQAAGRAK